MRPQRTLLLILSWTIFTTAARAQEAASPAPQALSLEQAVALAWEHSPYLEAMRQEVPAARARLAQARAQGRLMATTSTFLTAGTMMGNVTGTDPVSPRAILSVPNAAAADQNLMIMYPLSTGGRIGAQVAAATAETRAAEAELDMALLEVAYAVREAYWTVLLDRELVSVQEQNLTAQRERLAVDQAALEVGKIPQYYVLRDQAETADAEQMLTNAQRDLDNALLGLRSVMGLDLQTPVELTQPLAGAKADLPDADSSVATALQSRPDLVAALARLEAARLGISARRSAYRPQVSAALMADAFKMSGEEPGGGYNVGIVASLPLLDGGMRAAEVAEATAMAARLEAEVRSQRLEVERQVRSALLDLQAAQRNMQTAQAAQAAAEEDYRVALVRYQAGKAINLEPIEALNTLVRSRTNLAQATFESLLSRDALNRATGLVVQ